MANKKPLTKKRKAEMELKAKKEQQRKKLMLILYIAIAVLVVGGVTAWIVIANYEPPQIEYSAQIQIKDKGTVTVKLNGDGAPKAVAKFVELAKNGEYDQKTFYSLKNGMLYGGAENGDTSHIYAELNSGLSHKKGVISMQADGSNTVNPSSFFITLQDKTGLDKSCVAFGEITDGMSILEAIEVTDESQPVIEKVTIIEKKVKK